MGGSGEGGGDGSTGGVESADGGSGGGESDADRLKAAGVAPQYALHPESYYEYKLTGIVVHVGTAHAGPQ